MKKYFAFLVLCVFCFSLAAQSEYTITEPELERLETISANWEKSRQRLQLQAQNLKAKLNEALRKSETLNRQLSAERETSRNLRLSFNEYENAVQTTLTENLAQIEKLEKKNMRLKIAAIVLSCALFCGLVFVIMKFILKLKK